MRRVTRNGVLAVAAASGAMAVTMPVHADSAADGPAAGPPGLISGNTVQLPVHVPVNVCGNTANLVGLLNPAAGNTCANEDGGDPGGAAAVSRGKDSPGVLSGTGVQLPVLLPVNVSGNTVNVAGVGNPAVGNESVNTSGDGPDHPAEPTPKPSVPPETHRPKPEPVPRQRVGSLAHTGADLTAPVIAGSTVLVLGGAALYRRFRPKGEI
ncbi:chaplin [Streptomyces dysideae]|uniref:Chaplin domain-containing protein n=1 Tax=Streptomyces dysideae TaxID=909626 RepID=A0A124IDM4_9ACTN|nr:chaplin [Streptomyces dysideae]KUO15605.1 hypothetical protein AQJ91_40555 [Streptomyces dysideae]